MEIKFPVWVALTVVLTLTGLWLRRSADKTELVETPIVITKTYRPVPSIASSPGPRKLQLNYPPFPKEMFQPHVNNRPVMDPALYEQWAILSIGLFKDFDALMRPTGSAKPCSDTIIVAVVDTGIDYTHPDLVDHIWINRREIPSNGIDDDGNGFVDDVAGWDFVRDQPLPYDNHGHGTHISGIISATAGNGFGISGVCPGVKVMPLKYYDNSGVGYNNLQNTIRAIEYAVSMGADIINYSGGGADPSPPEQTAVALANKKGILFVAAAGNDSHDNDFTPYYPANYPLDNIIRVASLNQKGQLLPSSNFGKTVDIAAPGLSILSDLPDGKLGTMSGTSQATAIVSGAAALLLSQLSDKRLRDKDVKYWLMESADPLTGNEKKNIVQSGILNVHKALELAKTQGFAPKKPNNYVMPQEIGSSHPDVKSTNEQALRFPNTQFYHAVKPR